MRTFVVFIVFPLLLKVFWETYIKQFKIFDAVTWGRQYSYWKCLIFITLVTEFCCHLACFDVLC